MNAEIFVSTAGNYFVFYKQYVIKTMIPEYPFNLNRPGYIELIRITDPKMLADKKKEITLICEPLPVSNVFLKAVNQYIIPFLDTVNP